MSFDSACVFLFYHLHYYGGFQYVKKQILIAVCVVESSDLYSDFLVCKLQFHTVHFTVLFCKYVYSFSLVFTKLFLATTAARIILVKTTDFFYSVH